MKEEEQTEVSVYAPDTEQPHLVLAHLDVKPQNPKEGFENYVVVGQKTILSLYLENINDKIENCKSFILIYYPGNESFRDKNRGRNYASRGCELKINYLKENKFEEIYQNFFIPEIPGNHTIAITDCKHKDTVYKFVSSPGLANSKYRIPGPDYMISFNFYVYTEHDIQTLERSRNQLETANIALIISFIILIISIIQLVK